MEFQKYNSLEQASKQKVINAAVDAGHANIRYGVTEKIHGANFGIHWSSESGVIKFSRRSGFLDEGETFYAHTKIEDALCERMHKLVKYINSVNIQEGGEGVDTLIVYGEIYGGILNGETAQGSKRVQKEVQYSPETQFAAFDIVVNSHYLPLVAASGLLFTAGFHIAPLIGIYDSLEEALAVPNDLQPRVPQMLGYEAEGDNVSEGTVIRPWAADIYLPNGAHFILKNKNAKFKEKGAAKVAKPLEPMSSGDEDIFNEVANYLVESRLNAVISKEKELTQKDFGRIMGLFMQDALTDYDNDFVSDKTGHMKDRAYDYKRLNRELQKVAQGIVRQYWIENF
jgi:Rnl2 family RNA ligase